MNAKFRWHYISVWSIVIISFHKTNPIYSFDNQLSLGDQILSDSLSRELAYAKSRFSHDAAHLICIF